MINYTPEALAIHRERHGRYVQRGNCPSVYWTKAWCNLNAGHAGLHHTQGIPITASQKWDDQESDTCPCTTNGPATP